MARRLIACTLLLWYLPACTTWHTSDRASLKQLIATNPSTVRLTLTGGSRKVLHLVYISGDTLVGFRRGDPTRLALSDITQVAIPTLSMGKTIALGLGVFVVFAVPAAVIINANKHAGGEPVP